MPGSRATTSGDGRHPTAASEAPARESRTIIQHALPQHKTRRKPRRSRRIMRAERASESARSRWRRTSRSPSQVEKRRHKVGRRVGKKQRRRVVDDNGCRALAIGSRPRARAALQACVEQRKQRRQRPSGGRGCGEIRRRHRRMHEWPADALKDDAGTACRNRRNLRIAQL